MQVAEDQDQIELHNAEELIAEMPRIDGVDTISVQLGDDWSGDPAMWLVFKLRRDLDASDEWMSRFIDYASALQNKILQSGSKRFPYKRLERAA